jgi:hypothetical protein
VEASEEEDVDEVMALEKETLAKHLLNATIAIRLVTFNGSVLIKGKKKQTLLR